MAKNPHQIKKGKIRRRLTKTQGEIQLRQASIQETKHFPKTSAAKANLGFGWELEKNQAASGAEYPRTPRGFKQWQEREAAQHARASTAAVAAKSREQPNTRRRRRTVVTWFVSANADFLPAISFARPFLAIAWSHKQEQEDQSGTTSKECLLNFFFKWFGIRREGLVAKQGRFELGKRQAKK